MQEFNEKPDIPDFYGESADGAYGESKSQPPVEELTCGIEFLTDFWKEKYLREYIKNGGSKIKFIDRKSVV